MGMGECGVVSHGTVGPVVFEDCRRRGGAVLFPFAGSGLKIPIHVLVPFAKMGPVRIRLSVLIAYPSVVYSKCCHHCSLNCFPWGLFII